MPIPSRDKLLRQLLQRRDRRVRRRLLWGLGGTILGVLAAKWGPMVSFVKELLSR